MILDIDIGNSRLKWVLRGEQEEPLARGAFAHGDWPASPFAFKGAVSRVRIASVNGDLHGRIEEICWQRWGVAPQYARVRDGTGGLACGYRYPERLGIDRWLAVLACWCNLSKRALVVDAGSALTIDVLDGEVHAGGYIVPGYQMQRASLGANTWGVRVDRSLTPGDGPGDETAVAVTNGCLASLVGAIEHAAY